MVALHVMPGVRIRLTTLGKGSHCQFFGRLMVHVQIFERHVNVAYPREWRQKCSPVVASDETNDPFDIVWPAR